MKKNLSFLINPVHMPNKVCSRFISIVMIFFLLLMVSNANLIGQTKNITVSGIVKDSYGEPIAGVNIVVEGTAIGTISDPFGNYSLQVADNVNLVYSFIGFKQIVIPVKGKTKINVTLEEDISDLNEVVVVGYGTQKAGNLTGAIETIKMDKIDNAPVSNLAEALIDQIPALTVTGGSQRPGEAATLSIRQSYTWSKDGGSSVPLVVIDGMIQLDPNTGLPTLDQFNMLDPSEIESISVLKDASAAIYGSRASQGAVIVTTKKGKRGTPKITYSGQLEYKDAVSHADVLTGSDYGKYANTLMTNWQIDNSSISDDYFFSNDELYEMSKLNYNWLDKAWKASVTQRHSVGLSGGSDKVTYYAGASVYTQGANLGNQDYARYNFRSNINLEVNENLKLSANLAATKGAVEKSYTKSSASISSDYANGSRADYGILLHVPQYIPWSVDVDGEEKWFSPFVGPNVSNTSSMINSRQSLAGWNYFANDEAGSTSNEENMSYTANLDLEYKVPFITGLSLKGTLGLNQTYTETDQIQMPYDLVYQVNSNGSGHHLYSDTEELASATNEAQSLVMYDSNYTRNLQINFFVNYDRSFGDHNLSFMGSIEKATGYKSFERQYYEDPDANYLGDSSSAGTITDNSYVARYETGSLGYLGRLNYDFKSKYLFQFLFRVDASTKFAPENYWGFFPSVSGGWVMSSEDWFQEALSSIDFFKIRFSFGLTGKDNLKAWRWLQTYDYSNDEGYGFGDEGGELIQSLEMNATPNRNVKWDKTYKYNLGFDTKYLDSRLGLNLDLYYDQGRDMLMSLASEAGVPISSGGAYSEENYGAIDSWGYEVSASWSDHITSDLSYDIGITFGKGYNKVIKYYDQAVAYPAANTIMEGKSTIMPTWGFNTWNETSGGDGILRTDEDIDNYWNYLTEHANTVSGAPAYFDNTDKSDMRLGMLAYKDLAGEMNEDGTQSEANGKIDAEEDYAKLVDANKDFGFVTSLGIKYKSISFRTQLNTSWGEARFIDRVDANKPTGSYNLWAPESFWSDMYDYDSPMSGRYPLSSISENFYDSDFWKVSGFRCFVRRISVDYTLPKSLLSSAKISSASVGVQGFNLWDLSNPFPKKYRNMYDSSTTAYPTLRSWSVRVNVAF